MSRIKYEITIDARMINHSGIGTYIKNMIPNLVENYSVTLMGDTSILASFPWSKEIKIIEIKSPIYSISEQIELPGKIPESRLFISPHYNIPLRKIKAHKRAVIIHDVNHLININKISLVKRLYAKYMINAAIRKSDKIITVSSFSKNEIIKYASVKGKEIKIIYCGLDYEKLKNRLDEESIKKIKLKYNLPDEYFLFVGSIKLHKNLKAAIKAMNLLLENYPGKKLVIAGVDKEQFAEYKEILKFKDSVILTGYIQDSELSSIYRNAVCLIFPSFYEGFGLPAIEAMIFCCPVIASNAASIPEVCGDAALYFNPSDVDDLADKMKQIIESKNLREELVAKGFKNIERFSREKFAYNLKHEFDDTILN